MYNLTKHYGIKYDTSILGLRRFTVGGQRRLLVKADKASMIPLHCRSLLILLWSIKSELVFG